MYGIIDARIPDITNNNLMVLDRRYQIKIEEVLTIAIESFRHQSSDLFFKNSLIVVMCEDLSDSDIVKSTTDLIHQLWVEIYPWIYSLYYVYPPLKNMIIHHIEYELTYVRLFTMVDLL